MYCWIGIVEVVFVVDCFVVVEYCGGVVGD